MPASPTILAVPSRSSSLDPENGYLAIAVGIATSGRPAILAETLADLARQSLQPAQVFVLYGKQEDIGELASSFPDYVFAQATGGLCEKRNRIMDATSDDFDLIFFMDDDFYLDPEYLRVTEEAFRRDNNLVASSGKVIADGARGPGMTSEEAQFLLESAGASRAVDERPLPIFNTYGCNMAFRLSTAREHKLRFDENLPAYAWYEDIDFSRRIARYGSMVLLAGAQGVHLGAKVGRVSGRRLGYSQIANCIYLSRKGSFPWNNTMRSIGRNFLANLFRSLVPESYVDRHGRLYGNLLAVIDLLRGRMDPRRILHMQ